MGQRFTASEIAYLNTRLANAEADRIQGSWLIDDSVTLAKLHPTVEASIALGETAFSWGNHALVGYLLVETDPIFLAHPAASVTVARITNWNTAFGWGNHAAQHYAVFTNDLTQFVGNNSGADGEVLVNDGAGNVSWKNGGSVPFVIRTELADYTAVLEDYTILIDANGANVNITLPSAVGNGGKIFVIKAIDVTNTAKVTPVGIETIDGAVAFTFLVQYESVILQSDDANWWILAQV